MRSGRHFSLQNALRLLLTLICLSGIIQTAHAAPKPVAFIEVNVVPMDSDRVLRRQTVLTDGERIAAIGATGEVEIPENAIKVTGGAGSYLLPGLADMHTHVEDYNDLVLYTANGVTTILQMGDAIYLDMARMRELRAARGTIGPQVFESYFINGRSRRGGPFVATAQQARELVKHAKVNGYQFIKIYNDLAKDQFLAIVDEARTQGLGVVGHGVRDVGLPEALFLGQAMVAHAEEFYYTTFGEKYHETAIPKVVAATRQSGAYVTPNLSAYATMTEQWGKPEKVAEYMRDPRAKVMSPRMLLNWGRDYRAHSSGDLTPTLAFLKTFTRALHEAGVPLLTGTDSPPIPGMFPGYSIHDDLRSLHDIGLSNYDVLVAATRNAGDFIVKHVPGAQRFGQLQVGLRADAVLVNGNPLESLQVLQTPVGTLTGGRWVSAAESSAQIERQGKTYRDLYDPSSTPHAVR